MKSLDWLKKHLNTIKPPILYHYKTQEGLLGIMSTSEIWATKIQYLNDTSEFALALSLASRELQQRTQNTTNAELLIGANDLMEDIGGIQNVNICVCSFSEKRDSLSQWRGYGGGSSSYAIGFDSSYLERIADTEDFLFAKCIYSEIRQREIVRELIDSWLSRGVSVNWDNNEFITELLRIAPLLKNEHYSEEEEWRLISTPLKSNGERFSFRSGKSMIVPYYRISLAVNNGAAQIKEIVVGPCPHMNLSLSSVKMLATLRSIDHIDVVESSVPFRNW